MEKKAVNRPGYLIPALVGAVVIVVPSLVVFDLKTPPSWLLLPLFFFLGGVSAAYWGVRECPRPTLGSGSIVGICAGLAGCFFLTVGFWVSLSPEKYKKAIKEHRKGIEIQIQQFEEAAREQGTDGLEGIIDNLDLLRKNIAEREKEPENHYHSFRLQLTSLNAFLTFLMGFLGGLLGTVMFRKKVPPPQKAEP